MPNLLANIVSLNSAIWILGNVGLPLLFPLSVTWFFARVLNRPNEEFRRLITDGDLLFFSTTLSAVHITSAIGQLAKSSLTTPPVPVKFIDLVWPLIALLVALLLTSTLYGGIKLIKLMNQPAGSSSSSSGSLASNTSSGLGSNKPLFWGSIATTVFSVIVSYYMFTIGIQP
jgi:hypothetical protein